MAPLSASVIVVVPVPWLMNVPARAMVTGVVWLVSPSEGEAGVNTGAWFTLVTMIEAVSVT